MASLAKWVLLVFGFVHGVGLAQSAEVDPVALVRRAVDHRLTEAKAHRPLRYELRRMDDRRDTTKQIVETEDGDVARLVAEGGKPLNADAEKFELARLDQLEQHPELQQKRKRSEQKDAERVAHLLSLLPDALEYRFAGKIACDTGACYRLTFKPKPGWEPPDMEANLLRGVAGEVWIDQAQERLVRLDAGFIADVNFGFGILGRLYKGSTARLEQTDVGGELGGGHDWELTRLTLNVAGKALLVKSMSFKLTEETTHFAKVPPGNRLQRCDPDARVAKCRTLGFSEAGTFPIWVFLLDFIVAAIRNIAHALCAPPIVQDDDEIRRRFGW